MYLYVSENNRMSTDLIRANYEHMHNWWQSGVARNAVDCWLKCQREVKTNSQNCWFLDIWRDFSVNFSSITVILCQKPNPGGSAPVILFTLFKKKSSSLIHKYLYKLRCRIPAQLTLWSLTFNAQELCSRSAPQPPPEIHTIMVSSLSNWNASTGSAHITGAAENTAERCDANERWKKRSTAKW